MEQETQEIGCIISDMSDMVLVDFQSAVKSQEAEECLPGAGSNLLDITQALFQNENNESGEDSDDDDDDDSGTDNIGSEKSGTQLQRCERHGGESSNLPDTFQTSNLLFYERFKAYQDYMLGDCKPSEVKAFTADYLEKALEPCDWLALWSTDVFDVVVEVQDLDLNDLKACVKLVLPLQWETRSCEITEEAFNSLLEATQHKVLLIELQVVYNESGYLDQTALTLEHLRFFYKHIWRQWDEEDEDDDFDYFVRCVEPRLRLYYDILEDRVPAGLVAEYQSLLQSCSQCFQQFSELRSGLSPDSDSELDNVSMVEGLKLYDQLETFKRKLHIIENPLLRYVLAYKGSSRRQCVQSRGLRASGMKVVHVVTGVCSTIQLQSLLTARLIPLSSSEDTEIQFHRDPVLAVDACHQGDIVIVLPGTYSVSSSIFIPDSITIEGFGFPDEVVIENQHKGDLFVESTGADVRVSNIKFIQHDAIEGILCVRRGTLNMENCVLQCETTGVIVRTSARLTMNMCDLYGSKGAGVEIYPGSICSLVRNGIHHCKDGVLIKDFANELDGMPSITMENNVIHNNEDYGLILVKPGNGEELSHACEREEDPAEDKQEEAVSEPLSSTSSATKPDTQLSSNSAASQLESAGINSTDGDMASAAGKKWQFGRQLSRNKEVSCSRPVQDLMEHQIFVSVQGNQFKRNGQGDFGIFFY
ncbi:SHC SH2 domain-binding protein 1 isoform X1 [Girardinichthys multiradiatus]|uniref:SHC SH2 domain-binding protein 1 isoform X1 n=1 Tax=Girardinichthys multiradiatus TaxID=208333 RepID=UPI001FACDEEB|nr:SHC SH2 domain-binding protein 1 isoform X1 [Girardinichthys multiradiatus]